MNRVPDCFLQIMTLAGFVVVCQLVPCAGYNGIRFLARRRFRNDGIAVERAALQNKIARRSDEIQFGCRERRGLPPFVYRPFVLVRKRPVVALEGVLNRSKACEDADQMKTEGVAEEFSRKQVIEPPLR